MGWYLIVMALFIAEMEYSNSGHLSFNVEYTSQTQKYCHLYDSINFFVIKFFCRKVSPWDDFQWRQKRNKGRALVLENDAGPSRLVRFLGQ